MEITSVKHKGVKKIFTSPPGRKVAGIDPAVQEKIREMIAFIEASESPKDIVDAGMWKAHELTPKYAGTYSLWVTGNMRLWFYWDAAKREVQDMDYGDYHGKL